MYALNSDLSKELRIPPEYSNSAAEFTPQQSIMSVQGDEIAKESKPQIVERGIIGISAPAVKGLTVFTASVFIIGEMAGSGVLALPAAIVNSGWTGIAMLLISCLASGYCGSILGESWSTLREKYSQYREHVRHPYPAIGQKAMGKWGARAVTFCVNTTLIGTYFKFVLQSQSATIIHNVIIFNSIQTV